MALTRAVIALLVGPWICRAALAVPAEQPDIAVDQAVEEIVVTGSRLKRRDFNAPSPITTIAEETLDFSGQATLEEVLNQMPQMTPDFGRTANNPGDGTARLNLRGLGSGRTLVLLNGRRLAPSGTGSSVDVNNLPQSLIDRVEIITGGAATVYGSDAIAGVVNFITRDKYAGFNLEASAYTTEAGDSTTYDMNLAYGYNFANGRGNLALFGGYYDRNASFAGDRAFTSIPWLDIGIGELVPGGSSATPAGVIDYLPGGDVSMQPARATFDVDGNPLPFRNPDDLYNFAPLNYLQTPLRRVTTGVMLQYDVNEQTETYLELSNARNDARQNLAPVPVFSSFVTNIDNPMLTPSARQFFVDNLIPAGPGVVSLTLGKRLEELGPRIIDNSSDYTRFVAGLRGDISATWDFDVWLTYTHSDEHRVYVNDASRTRLQQGLLVDPLSGQCFDPANGCAPLNLFGSGKLSPAAVEFLRLPHLLNVTTREQKVVSGYIRGTPRDTWAGPINLAMGAEWREDSGHFRADDALFTGDTLGFRGDASVEGSETVFELFAEAMIPLLSDHPLARTLSVEIGGRYSRYDIAGPVTTYKYGGEWQPLESLRFRSMFQRSVRAPNLTESFQREYSEPGTFVFDGLDDPCSSAADPVASGNAGKCMLQGIPADQLGRFEAFPGFRTDYVRGGDRLLEPEKARTVTVGAVVDLDTLQNWQLSVDFFELEVRDTIGMLRAREVCFDPANTSNAFCRNIVRDPLTYNVVEVHEPFSNRGTLRNSGIDTQISYYADLPESLALGEGFADIDVDIVWTRMLKNTVQEFAGGSTLDCSGAFGEPCNFATDGNTFPDDRVTTNAHYRSGDFNLHLTWRWIGGSENAEPRGNTKLGLSGNELVIPRIGAKHYVDLGIGYRFGDNVYARMNVANVFDTRPPMMANAVYSNNTDAGMYDIFGRSYFLGLSLQY